MQCYTQNDEYLKDFYMMLNIISKYRTAQLKNQYDIPFIIFFKNHSKIYIKTPII